MNWNNPPKNVHNKLGFVYEITNKVSGRKYVGQKRMWFEKRLPKTKTRKTRRKVYYESDWKTYTGSSEELNKDIEKLGIENFSFVILKYCYSKFQLHYYELEE